MALSLQNLGGLTSQRGTLPIEVDVDFTSSAFSELRTFERRLDGVQADANQIENKINSLQKKTLAQKLDKFKPVGPTNKGGFSLTTEGLQAGAFKITDTGFTVEGVASQLGGGFIATAAVGRIAAGTFGGVVATRDLIRKGVNPLEAATGAAIGQTADTVRNVANAFGFEQAASSLLALVEGKTEEQVKQEFNDAFSQLKLAFQPTIRRQIEEQIEKKLKEVEDRIRYDARVANAALFEAWAIKGGTESDINRDLERFVEGRIIQDREERRKKVAQDIPDGAGV
jgi:hypothetical protein